MVLVEELAREVEANKGSLLSDSGQLNLIKTVVSKAGQDETGRGLYLQLQQLGEEVEQRAARKDGAGLNPKHFWDRIEGMLNQTTAYQSP